MRLRRGELVDWYVEHEESAVLVEGHVLVLSPLATSVLDVVDSGWVSMDLVVEHLVARFGEPSSGDAAALVGETVDQLAEWGVVVRDEADGSA